VDDRSLWLVARWRQGDQEAAEELFHRYYSRLIGLARSRLSGSLATRLDPEDVVQSVYRSFFHRVRDQQYVFERSGELWQLLVAMTLHKLLHQVKRHQAARRSVAREQGPAETDSWLGLDYEALAREPTADEAVAVLDEVEQVLRGLAPLHRRMVEMRLQGYSTPEIATEVQRSNRMVRLVLRDVHDQLSQRLLECQES
jgi:RNA polymerase sigma-70 factor (ECF subfamily)